MARQELLIGIRDVTHLQIFCGNPNCWTTITYLVEAVPENSLKKCPACGKNYPKSLVAAIENYGLFFKNAVKSTPAQMTLPVEL
jgi:hypothetical protein